MDLGSWIRWLRDLNLNPGFKLKSRNHKIQDARSKVPKNSFLLVLGPKLCEITEAEMQSCTKHPSKHAASAHPSKPTATSHESQASHKRPQAVAKRATSDGQPTSTRHPQECSVVLSPRAVFFLAQPRPPWGLRCAHSCFLWGSAAGRRCLILFCVPGTTLNCPSTFAERRCLERRRGSVHHMVFGCVRVVGCVAARGVLGAGQQRVGGANQKTEEVITSLKNPHLMPLSPPWPSAHMRAELSHFFELEACFRMWRRNASAPQLVRTFSERPPRVFDTKALKAQLLHTPKKASPVVAIAAHPAQADGSPVAAPGKGWVG